MTACCGSPTVSEGSDFSSLHTGTGLREGFEATRHLSRFLFTIFPIPCIRVNLWPILRWAGGIA